MDAEEEKQVATTLKTLDIEQVLTRENPFSGILPKAIETDQPV